MDFPKRLQGSEQVTRTPIVAAVSLCFAVVLAGGCVPLQFDDHQRAYRHYDEIGKHAYERGDRVAAEQAFQQAVVNAQLGRQLHEELSVALLNLTVVKRRLCKHNEAEQLLQQSLETGEKVWGPEHPNIGRRLFELGGFYYLQDRFAETASVMQRGVTIYEKRGLGGLDQAKVAYTLAQYIDALRKIKREAEAQAVDAKLNAVRSHRDYNRFREKAWESQDEECKAREK